MDIDQACKTIRRANDAFLTQGQLLDSPVEICAAVDALRAWLEDVRGDGKHITELAISPALLVTPAGMRWVMNFVTSAETLAAARRRASAN